MIVYQVRHGETTKEDDTFILLDKGHREASTAKRPHELCEDKPRRIFSSKMIRAIQT